MHGFDNLQKLIYTSSSLVSVASSLSLLTSSVSNSSALISASEKGDYTSRTSASTSVKEALSMFFKTESG